MSFLSPPAQIWREAFVLEGCEFQEENVTYRNSGTFFTGIWKLAVVVLLSDHFNSL